MKIKDEMGNEWKKAFMAAFMIPFQYLTGGSEEVQESIIQSSLYTGRHQTWDLLNVNQGR
jgi:hypothetical protein